MKAYLKNLRDVGEGHFSRERILVYTYPGGEEIIGFFDESLIKNGMLEVNVLGEVGDQVYIVPPQEGFEGMIDGLQTVVSTLSVKRKELYIEN